jgi:3-deoxy-D-manno-octulosonate 8-phosphate phosphatase (KDO 8-P phosphatase)
LTYKKVDMDKVRRQAANVRLLVLDVDGVLTDGRLLYDAKGNECKEFHVHDGYGIRRALDAGIDLAIISGRKSIPVQKRADELGIKYVFLGIRDKVPTLEQLISKLGISMGAVAYVGDDVPDLECLQAVGLAIAVANAHPDLDAVADWHTHANGGCGAVREVCDLLLSSLSDAETA